jgi:hypothetical protein
MIKTDIQTDNFYYNQQLRKHIVQFMAIFSGMKVSIGKNDFDSASNLITVPVLYGSRDRVVSYIFSEQTQNKMIKLPMMSVGLIGLDLARDRLAGQNQERKEVKLKRGGTIPDDLQQHTKLKPVPYEITMELAINASNTDQHFQILEQIMLLFNPSLQIQVSDAYGNQQSIIEVFLQSLNLEENYPAGTDSRIVSSTLTFQYIMYLASPVNLKDEIIKSIQIRINGAGESGFSPSELNDGKIDPFIISTKDAPTN